MGASALIKLCADQDDLDKGLELFYKMTSTRTTLNRYAGGAHACGRYSKVCGSREPPGDFPVPSPCIFPWAKCCGVAHASRMFVNWSRGDAGSVLQTCPRKQQLWRLITFDVQHLMYTKWGAARGISQIFVQREKDSELGRHGPLTTYQPPNSKRVHLSYP
eukprot:scaffold112169_cov21-Tisochrysis_lutea.AAC.1